MNDKQWFEICLHQEREALLASLKTELKNVPEDVMEELEADFTACLDKGGVESVYALSEAIDWHGIPIMYSLVTEHFVRSRRPPAELTKRIRVRQAKQLSRLAKSIEQTSKLALSISNGPSWCSPLGNTFTALAIELDRLASEGGLERGPHGPGKPMRCSTRLALGLNALFREPELPMTRRCHLIAAVASSFIEPVTGEQIRQRINDLGRRGPHAKARKVGPSSSRKTPSRRPAPR